MKEILYPIVRTRPFFALRKLLTSTLLFLFITSFSLSLSANTVVIGSGSGGFTQSSMGSLNPHDTLAITAGTYTAGSCSLSNLDSITIIPYKGNVTFTGGGSFGFGSNMVGDTWESLPADGYYFTFNNTNIQFQSGHTQSCRFLYLQFTNCTNVCFDASNSSFYKNYVGTTASLMLYKTVVDYCKFTSCQQMVQGFYGTPNQNECISDSIELAYDTVLNTTSNGAQFSGCFTHVNFHHNYIYYNGDNTLTGDVGALYYNGDGQVHHNKLLYGRGYLTRVFMYSLGSTAGNFYFYDNLIYGQTEYGGLDIRCDTTQFGTNNPYMTKTNGHVYNNTEGNKTTVEGYITPLAIIGTLYYPSGNATVEVKNNFAFNVINVNNGYGDGSYFATNFSGGTWTEDTSNNQYATGAQATNFIQDTNSTWMPQPSSYLIGNGTNMAEPYAPSPDLYGFSYSNNIMGARANNAGAINANAGSSQTITLPVDSVKLSGSASSGTITAYGWSVVSGPNVPTITTATAVTTSVSGLIAGTYSIQLKVTGSTGTTSTATVTITVNPAVNKPPVVSAGSNQAITLPTSSVTLSGTASDSTGTITTYAWTQVSGPSTAVIVSASALKTSITTLVAGTYVFQLTVTDNNSLSASATVTVTVSAAVVVAPVVSAGSAQAITLPTSSVTLSGTASDASGTITAYLWTEVSGPNTATIVASSALKTSVTGLTAGTYVFLLTVINNDNLSGTGTVTITVYADEPPVVSAGSNQSITLPTSTATLSGSATDTTGTITSYLWTEVSGPNSATIVTSSAAKTSVTSLMAGTYVFQLKVLDNNGLTGTATVTVTVNPDPYQAPVVSAGSNQSITLPTSSVTVSGTATDSTGTITSYLWTEVSGPTTATIVSSSALKTSVTGLAAGTYVFQLKVTDNNDLSATATVTITVKPEPDQPPVVNAGTNQTITLPANTVSLSGSVTDATGTVTSYIWSELSGPNTASIVSAQSINTVVAGLVAGSYVFQLTAKDNNNLSGTGSVTITVNPDPDQPPVVSAGSNQTITLPTSSVTLSGAATDSTGTISSYQWTEVSGPNTATIVAASALKTTVSGLVAGSYVFQLKVTDNNNLSGTAIVTVTVNPAPHEPPVANAGTSQTITLPLDSVVLNGNGSTDPDGTIVSYSWSQVSGPSGATLSRGATSTPEVSNLIAGNYTFELTVTDNDGATGTADVKVIVNPAPKVPPIANAGADQIITLPTNTVTLDGDASKAVNGVIVSFAWTQVSGPSSSSLASSSSVTTVVNNLVQGTYVFRLTVTNSSGLSSSDTVSVLVNAAPSQPPVAIAGPSKTITLPLDSTSLNGTSSYDSGGTISSYIWAQVYGPSTATIAGGSSATPEVSELVAGTYAFELTVTNSNGQSSSAEVKVTVNPAANVNPVANAGANQTITLPVNEVSLNGSASIAPGGTLTGYAWAMVSGPAQATIASPGSAITEVTGLVQGTYIFQLTVTDNNGNKGVDSVTITVKPAAHIPPVANAGPSVSTQLPDDSVSLNGSQSYDNDGTIVSYSWSQVSGPSTATIENNGSIVTTVTNLTAGQYYFQLTVTDNFGSTSTSVVKVTVAAAPSQPPVANAGADQSITLPTDSVVVNGGASTDAGGTIVSYSWTQTSGPATATIESPSGVTSTITNLVQGTYIFMLTVTDNNGLSSSDTLSIVVNQAPDEPPVANAGTDQVITLPVNTVTLNGSASYDPDGTIVSYSWIKSSGGGAVTITNANTPKPIVTGLGKGNFSFKLTIMDNHGASASAQVSVTVNPAVVVNQSPIANAGSNQNITLPDDSVQLNGTASSDPNGTISYYSWSEASGSSGISISNPNTSTPEVTGLQAGQYTFQLVVTNSTGITDTAAVTITVKAPANQPPIASAGSDTTITIPSNSLVLNGSASKTPYGNITSYQWVQTSGPSTAVISASDSAVTTASQLNPGIYIFQLTVTNSEGLTNSATVSDTVVNNLRTSGTQSSLSLYPNPATNQINLQVISDTTGTLLVNIYDMRGKLVMATEYSKPSSYFSAQLFIEGLNGGTYVLQAVIAKKTVMVAKFVKQ